MSFLSFAQQSVTIVTPGVIVERGREVEDWSEAAVSRRTVEGCHVQPGSGSRDFEHSDGVTADFTVYLPPTVSVPRRARIELPVTDGQFILQGEPQAWIYGLSTDHVQIRLRRRDG